MSLSKLRSELLGLDLAIQTLRNKRTSILSQIKIKEKPVVPQSSSKSTNPKFEKNLKLLRLGLTNSKRKNKDVPDVAANLTLEQLGREGEIAFWNYLNEILDMEVCTITWMNKVSESRKPFDFIVYICEVPIYVDVKCTRGNFHSEVYMSSYELDFAKRNSSNYFIARLYQWGNSKIDKKYKADSFNVKLLTCDQVIKQFKLE